MTASFETDLVPDTLQPRVRINYANGWSASVVIRTPDASCEAQLAALSACPTGRWSDGMAELGEQEATAEQVVDFLNRIRNRPSLIDRGPLLPRLDIVPIEPHTACRACGCTPGDACLHDRQPCSWVEDDLCSRCEALGRGRAAA
ncbi:hypothetical protein [Sphingomonas jatrophae]|uniref:Uncharacterized protein n=1 Tax=Sphingomonas jatrophae TaxID=1166337 RepID=A0A1I6K6F5_9SPHN|nr:hypothetical protein [Sphingomonas jatrophae]SFR86819.1 hypothetical protein SAMN05192580_1379 [Sphingomonas jatrophae]